ncbi:DUF3616 domain-containing protein [Anatilimnocola floriformis]|uniref:DUF3616 domain-containing protein n=1 Tax=Anatilimnocola floriformis TaxID=2948575 RepID=UPI0020C581BD|nr:DUF3616 domain-containing protein [Anatilimnocola floriformis]
MAKITFSGVVKLKGILGGKDASAVGFWNGKALIVSDEVTDRGNVLQIFEADGTDYRAVPSGTVVLDKPRGGDEEMDLEGIAVAGNDIYVIGSHSAKRKRVDPTKPYARNRAALFSQPSAEPTRDVLLRFTLSGDGEAGTIARFSLRGILHKLEPFKQFSKMASKENGVDVEGLAFFREHVYVGFRGPILRGNFTPVMRCKVGKKITKPEVLFVDLGGRGVRDLAHVSNGVVILAGPMGDGPGSYRLYWWDGEDHVPGVGSPAKKTGLRLIGDLPPPVSSTGVVQTAAKAEGLAVLKDEGKRWEILVVYDGLKQGQASRFTVDLA